MKEFNHEVWLFCEDCNCEFDLRRTLYCPDCRKKYTPINK